MRLGTLAGIEVDVHPSWLIVMILFVISLSVGWLPALYPGADPALYVLLGFFTTILIFISILMHEVGHALVARRHGLEVKSITLYVFGGVSNIEQEAHSPGVEFQVSLVGPLVSLLISLICFALWFPVRNMHTAIEAILEIVAITNLFIGIFNLIPAYPLDGGRVLRSILWKVIGNAARALRITTTIGIILSYLLIILGIFLVFSSDIVDGIWIVFVGWFLLSAAQSTRLSADFNETLGTATVAQFMNRDFLSVPANISLQRLIDEYLIPHGQRSAFVMQGDYFAGMVTLSDVMQIGRDAWSHTTVGMVMVPAARLHTTTPDRLLKDILPLMNGNDVNQLPVLQNEKLVGVISRDMLMRAFSLRRSLRITQPVQPPQA